MALSEKTLQFLFENRMQNSRDWFHEHKADYRKYVAEPLLELAEKLLPVALEIEPGLPANPKRAVSRINRDTRFSKDKSLYRDNMWIVFHLDREAHADAPGFYFEFSPEGFGYGCGYYRTSPKTMDALREMVLEGDPLFEAARKSLEKQTVFYLDGECYKRPRYAGQPEYLRNWLERRTVCMCHDSTDRELLYSEALGERIGEGFRLLKPVYCFFREAGRRGRERDLRA